MQQPAGFTYSAEPRAVQPRKKFREPTQTDRYGNMMYDRRVVRGNTYSAQALPLTPQPDTTKVHREAEKKKRTLITSRDSKTMTPPTPSTPEPVAGRKHIEIQTEQYLEELSDKVPEFEVATQTDFFLDRPTSPLFIPAKTGVDAETQIEDDLFDFDHEVEPILDVLLGKTLEQAMLEVLEEDEIHAIRLHRDQMQQTRLAELAAMQQMEEAERRKVQEKV
ncbi:putative Flagellar radial spoke protein 3 [Paratrimastix pyriformis]|uniref:Flagellar radial spoke protein 3 n=1 Tax=Paratrimastix pyriformis TaxID=342808 RepID=A0ABQ8UPC0_9EUKA|nr:putative Flagellar radial spoke protein 3 [Paratrimastix pyriformis]